MTAATLTSRQRAALDAPGAPPRGRPLTPVGTRVIWLGGRHPLLGTVVRHSSTASFHSIFIEWVTGGEGRFLDNAWPWELRRDNARARELRVEQPEAAVCPSCGHRVSA